MPLATLVIKDHVKFEHDEVSTFNCPFKNEITKILFLFYL
jgi:hypothetical protein